MTNGKDYAILSTDNTEESALKERTNAYMAGFTDADGCISIGHVERSTGVVQHLPQIILCNNHLPTMKWIAKNFGGNIRTVRHKNPNWNTSYRIVICSEAHTRRFLSRTRPYMVLKKAQADAILSYHDATSQEQREMACQTVERLNHSVTTETPSLSYKQNLINAYLAGLLDGEGCITVSPTAQHKQSGVKYMPGISFTNTEKFIANWFEDMFGGFVVDREETENAKASRQWFLSGNDKRERFLLAMLPYMKTKREQAKLMLSFVRLRGQRCPEKRQKIADKIKSLNGRKIQSELMGDHERVPAEMLAT